MMAPSNRPVRPSPEGRFPAVLSHDRLDTFYGDIALGNGTQWKFFLALTPEVNPRVFVGIELHGAYAFDDFAETFYVAEKLGLLPGDAMNVADLINDQFPAMRPEWAKIRQGNYDSRFVEVCP